jgi:bilirubin oxidase
MRTLLIVILSIVMLHLKMQAQNPVVIPDTISGVNFNLNILDTSHTFYPGFTTNTYGVNADYFGPTLIFNKGDSIDITVSNQLMDTTTLHWHGLHVSAANDGGPHITIPPGTTWNPKFTVRDQAATYWYHPHLHMMTNMHVTGGAAGFIIVRDTQEAAFDLPRTYGIDDFPLAIQSKCFDAQKQILIDNAYDSVMMVNGTLNPYLDLPAQIIRLRILNASPERVYNLGLSNGQSFHQIASDGGLLNAPVTLTRLVLAPGERAEILLDLNGMSGQSFNLMSFASQLPNGIYGATQPGMMPGQSIPGYTSNPLNGADFMILSINVLPATLNPVTNIPSALIINTPYNIASANITRQLTFSPVNMGPTAIQGPFFINNSVFDMGVINYTIPYNNIEVWTLTNQTPIAHPFHLHAVQFYITQINGVPAPLNQQGRKDVVLVPPLQSVSFITRFETFCDSMMPFMYHCHMLPHEDDGMMGQFVVSCPVGTGINDNPSGNSGLSVTPNPSSGIFNIQSTGSPFTLEVTDFSGKQILNARSPENKFQLDMQNYSSGMYFLKITTAESQYVAKIILE